MRRLGAAIVLLLSGCSSSVTPVRDCDAVAGIIPVCRFQNPEDLVATPSGHWLLVSQMSAPETAENGSIAAYQPGTDRVEILFPVGEFDDVREWGEAACAPPAPEAFAPHGIDLTVRPDGAWQLLVVNHAARDRIEYFAVEESNAGLAVYWRGCVPAPAKAYLNDVVARRPDGFWVTDTLPHEHRLIATLGALLFGIDTGRVWRFTRSEGFVAVPGSGMSFPNGIAQAPGDDSLYVTSFFGNEIRRIDTGRGEVTGRMRVRHPDNLTWSAGGELLVASQSDSLGEIAACRDLVGGSCGATFEVLAVDPAALTMRPVLAHRGAPIGGVSVALELGDEIYLGTFAGDRIARWRWHH